MPPSVNCMGTGSTSGSAMNESVLVSDLLSEGVAGICSDERKEAMSFVVFGDIALRSRYSTEGASATAAVPLRSARCFDAVLQPSNTLLAVAMASRGGTMLRMMSASTTSCSSDGTVIISADLMRFKVD